VLNGTPCAGSHLVSHCLADWLKGGVGEPGALSQFAECVHPLHQYGCQMCVFASRLFIGVSCDGRSLHVEGAGSNQITCSCASSLLLPLDRALKRPPYWCQQMAQGPIKLSGEHSLMLVAFVRGYMAVCVVGSKQRGGSTFCAVKGS